MTRSQLGWPASAAPDQPTARGVKIHYEGTFVSPSLAGDHSQCVAEVQAIRASHLANTKEGYVDVAYSYLACVHGILFEGRGIGKRTAANGDQDLNRAHYAVCALIGDKGLTQPTDALLSALRDGIDLLRQHGAGGEVLGHCDGYATECPGTPLIAWVRSGAPRPGGSPAPSQPSTGAAPAWPGRYLADYCEGQDVAAWQQQMAARGWQITVDGKYGSKSATVCRSFQSDKGLDSDGVVGPKTWSAAWTAPIT
ncbi:N-acetylmuramoyl-L-alanine amidase [Kitasatospora sp. NBC_01287]|uniref:peptidoglycan recognition protein family protein n=1 Tax=Kitasatospora sp. NBC_01287 TaxID=2903573 RepID=UPI0022594C42|nr:N-acetylmuramoyl-L-alanine amidase [Kitasatospora sp. NBC_01287]MCX4749245.1 N-acetylmuramoyl-L-alanine amidase [Kitasatospora sp. NBC_01287]